ncbi:putative transporter [Lachnellula suecica]|uniref:Putative transporter n=1 Tax=Lachnellula suecica TaxID=602035 RepID=A0A8T9C6M0_9HELO|nr:putative transporter [Lachnellula suecica]
MWGLYFIGLVAYIPATPVAAYLTLTLKRLGYSTFDSNILTIPAAVLQIIRMLTLCYSSDYFNERTFHCIFREFWILPLLAALIALPDGGKNYENTFNVKKRAITAAIYNVIVQIGSLIGSQIYRSYDSPYYHQGNKVLIAICVLSLAAFLMQRAYLSILNNRKEKKWEFMTWEERSAYQNNQNVRELDGNKRLDFRFKY